MDQFGACAGLKRNEGKTEAYWLGSFHNRHEHLDIKTINKPIKILGIHFTYDRRKCQELNFDTTLTSIIKTLNFWRWRNLTVLGRMQIVKTFVLPKCMHRAALICFDNTVIKEINTTIYNFVWKGKYKVKRMALISDYKDGGLKMPHIESVVKTQRILCVKRFLDERDSPWKKFFLII